MAIHLKKPEALEYRRAHASLLQTFRDDFGKYAGKAKHKYLENVVLTAPGMISRRYVYRKVDSDIPSRDLKEAVTLLEKAGILTRIRASSEAGLPLEASANNKKYKLAFLDIGLVQAALGLDASVAASSDFMAINSGALAEQFVAQELTANSVPYEKKPLYYWRRDKRGSSAEVGFLFQFVTQVLPFEVKSGSTGRLKSMRMFIDQYKAPCGIRVSQHPLSFHDHILSIPFYLMPVLNRLVSEALS